MSGNKYIHQKSSGKFIEFFPELFVRVPIDIYS